MGRVLRGGALPPFWDGLGPHRTQTPRGGGLTPYSVASSCIKPFGHNRNMPKIGEGVCAPFLSKGSVSPELDTFCYPTAQTAPCYVRSFWHNTGMWRTDRRTDRQTDGIAVASTALAMRAMRRAVKMSPVMCLIASTFVQIVRYPINTVHWHDRLSLRLVPVFYTATDTVTDLVNIEHVGNRQQDSRSCLVHPVDSFDSERWFSCNSVIF